ncbi:MAG: GNAT family N-acetyltransferase [Polyangiaceae bacterium]
MTPATEVRPAVPEDLAKVSVFAGRLVRMHHDTDPDRFFLPPNVEDGYRWWFGKEITRDRAIVLVAVRDGDVVGYAYGAFEERDWNMLLDEHGALHDIFVEETARKTGAGKALLRAMIAALEAKGAARIVLSTMVGNTVAQAAFRDAGFRPTMLEMTRSRA